MRQCGTVQGPSVQILLGNKKKNASARKTPTGIARVDNGWIAVKRHWQTRRKGLARLKCLQAQKTRSVMPRVPQSNTHAHHDSVAEEAKHVAYTQNLATARSDRGGWQQLLSTALLHAYAPASAFVRTLEPANAPPFSPNRKCIE